MDIKRLEVYHTPTKKSNICICLNMEQFSLDCEQFIIDKYKAYSVNPKERFYARIDKLIDDVSRGVTKIPHRFRMRLESRHSNCNEKVHYAFQLLDRTALENQRQGSDISDESLQVCLGSDVDYIVLYIGMNK